MARPQKEGLSYFPCDVDIFEDDKLFDVQNEYGPLGEIIYLRLLCLIYKNGYYLRFESLDKLASMLIKSIGNKWARDKKSVMQVIPFLAKCNLFSSELMQENVLTSASIQRRYLKVTERRQTMNKREYWLLEDNSDNSRLTVAKNEVNVDDNGVNVYNNSVNVDDNTQSKEKESKVNKSKVKEESKKVNKDNITSISVRESNLESYEDIMDDMAVAEVVKPMLWQFIKHCQLNRRTLTNDKLTNILVRLDFGFGRDEQGKIECLSTAINGGYYDIKV